MVYHGDIFVFSDNSNIHAAHSVWTGENVAATELTDKEPGPAVWMVGARHFAAHALSASNGRRRRCWTIASADPRHRLEWDRRHGIRPNSWHRGRCHWSARTCRAPLWGCPKMKRFDKILHWPPPPPFNGQISLLTVFAWAPARPISAPLVPRSAACTDYHIWAYFSSSSRSSLARPAVLSNRSSSTHSGWPAIGRHALDKCPAAGRSRMGHSRRHARYSRPAQCRPTVAHRRCFAHSADCIRRGRRSRCVQSADLYARWQIGNCTMRSGDRSIAAILLGSNGNGHPSLWARSAWSIGHVPDPNDTWWSQRTSHTNHFAFMLCIVQLRLTATATS